MVCGDVMRVRGEECDDGNAAPGDGCDATCRVEPYAGAPQAAIDAMHAMNLLRAAADLPGSKLNMQIVGAAQAHASYYSNNAAAYSGGLSAHNEDPAFPNGFTGADFGTRMSAAGFAGPALFETMAFSANPSGAIAQWMNSVFHRIPLIHPNMTQFGYALSTAMSRANDVADYSRGNAEKPNAVIVWPPPNATGIPRSFNRSQEGPMPPAPPGGGNTTGPIISVMFANGSNGTITSHALKDAGGATLPDTMIAKNDAQFGGFMSGSYCFYAAGPAAAGSKFTVEIAGTVGGQAFSQTWSFTTQ
jgi:cysteine-rich repeat protein